jgi:hypothetical protein
MLISPLESKFEDVSHELRTCHQTNRSRRALNTDRKLRCATHFDESLAVALHFAIVGYPRQGILQHSHGILIRRLYYSVVHPRSLSSCADNSGSTQVSQVPADLRLIGLEYFDKEAYAYLIAPHEI